MFYGILRRREWLFKDVGLVNARYEQQTEEYNIMSKETETTDAWASEWLDSVANGSNTMSQRKLSSIEQRGGGLDAVKAIATEKGVHLLLLEDDKGNELVAASVKPFTVVC